MKEGKFAIALGFYSRGYSRKVQTTYLSESKELNYICTYGKEKYTGGNFENTLKQFSIGK